MYDLRRTMYDLNASAPVARENGRRAVSAYGQRGCAAPEGRTGRAVPVSQFAMFARFARENGRRRGKCVFYLVHSGVRAATVPRLCNHVRAWPSKFRSHSLRPFAQSAL